MARVLDVPFSALGDMTKKQPLNLSVLNLGGEASGNSVSYNQARRFMEVTKTTGRTPAYKAPEPTRRPEHTVRDVAFAKWESVSLPANMKLEAALRKVLEVNSQGLGGKNQILKIKIKFTDGSDICFARDSPSNPSTLKYTGFYSPNGAFDATVGSKTSGGGGIGPNGLTSASVLDQKKKMAAARNLGVQYPDASVRKMLFKRLDPNNNGLLSLAELDKGVIELWPQFNNKPAIMRAYKASDINGTGWIGKAEFDFFLKYLVNYNTVYATFSTMDKSNDRRVTLDEYLGYMKRVDKGRSEEELTARFNAMDANGGGYLLFDEFCDHVARKKTDLQLRPDKAQLDAFHERMAREKAEKKRQEKLRASGNGSQMSGSSVYSRAAPFEIPDAETRKSLFRRFDPNGNGLLSLAELDKSVIELWPRFNNKPALMRAYKAADVNGTGFIGKSEFEYFLRFLVHYTNLWNVFAQTDANNDRRVNLQEFLTAASRLQIGQTETEARQAFIAMDKNQGGYVLFDEFCTWMAKHKTEHEMPKVPKRTKPPTPANKTPTPPVRRTPLPTKHAAIDVPDAKSRRALFNRIDPNGNGYLSLAELDKGIIELWPQFNNKPAVMRAYKAADASKNGWIGRREFDFFLRYLVTYNNLWSSFSYADSSNDRRVSRKEFLDAAAVLGLNSLTDSQLSQMFDEMDKNGGGYVLFDEFCATMASVKANEQMANDK